MSTHTRIRPLNTRDTYPEQNLDNDLCQAVIAGDTIYLRGQIGQNLDTSESVGVGDVTAQAEQAMADALKAKQVDAISAVEPFLGGAIAADRNDALAVDAAKLGRDRGKGLWP